MYLKNGRQCRFAEKHETQAMNRSGSTRLVGLLFVAFASFALFSMWKEWHQSPQRNFLAATGKVLGHSIAIHELAWMSADPEPIRLSSNLFSDGQEILVSDYFESADDAWAAAEIRPAGSQQTFFADANGQKAVWRRLPKFRIALFLFVSIFLLLGLSASLRETSRFSFGKVAPIAIGVVFCVAGGGFTADAIKSMVRSFKAAGWPEVNYEIIDTKRLKSGKHGVTATAFRYTSSGQKFETVVRSDLSADGKCRVSPEKPWMVAFNTNYFVATAAMLPGLLIMAAGGAANVLSYRESRRKKSK